MAFDRVSGGNDVEIGSVPYSDGVSSFYDDVRAVWEVGRVDDEAVFEGEGLVRRTHDGVTGMHRLSLTGSIER